MDVSVEDTKKCNNCGREISAANYLSHTVHCERNFRVCPACGEMVARSNLEEHQRESHQKVACPACHACMERKMLELHQEAECPKALIACPYCELEWPRESIEENHIDYCGSRSDHCDLCGKKVLIKNMAEHKASGCSRLAMDPPPRPPSSSSSEDEIYHDVTSGEPPFFRPRVLTDDDVARQVFGGMLSQNAVFSDILGDLMGGERYRRRVDQRIQPAARTIPIVTEPDEDADVKIPCERCGQPFSTDRILAHQEICDRSRPPTPVEIEHSLSSLNLDQTSNRSPSASMFEDCVETNVADSAPSANAEALLPCEFCFETFPPDMLFDHQLIHCSKNPAVTVNGTKVPFKQDNRNVDQTGWKKDREDFGI